MDQNPKQTLKEIERHVRQLEEAQNDEEAAKVLNKIIGILDPIVDKHPKYRELRDEACKVLPKGAIINCKEVLPNEAINSIECSQEVTVSKRATFKVLPEECAVDDYTGSPPVVAASSASKPRRIIIKSFIEIFNILKFDCQVSVDACDSDNVSYTKADIKEKPQVAETSKKN